MYGQLQSLDQHKGGKGALTNHSFMLILGLQLTISRHISVWSCSTGGRL